LLVALGFCLLVVQTALATLIPMHSFAPNLVLPIAIHLGVASDGSLVRGATISFVLGYLLDAFCGNPMGLQTFVLCASFMVARGAGARLMPQGAAFQIFSTFLMAGLSGATVVALRAIFEQQSGLSMLDNPLQAGLTLLRSAGATAVLSTPVFALARRIDSAPRSEDRAMASQT
jgi:rod shape-determining protein MreD